MTPVYPLVSLWRPRGPENLGGGRPLHALIYLKHPHVRLGFLFRLSSYY